MNRGWGHLQFPGYGSDAQAVPSFAKHSPGLFVQRPGAAQLYASLLCRLQPGVNPFTDDAPFKLSHGHQNVQLQFAGWIGVAGVDALAGHNQCHAVVIHLLQDQCHLGQ